MLIFPISVLQFLLLRSYAPLVILTTRFLLATGFSLSIVFDGIWSFALLTYPDISHIRTAIQRYGIVIVYFTTPATLIA
jgi:hypothetical protein